MMSPVMSAAGRRPEVGARADGATSRTTPISRSEDGGAAGASQGRAHRPEAAADVDHALVRRSPVRETGGRERADDDDGSHEHGWFSVTGTQNPRRTRRGPDDRSALRPGTASFWVRPPRRPGDEQPRRHEPQEAPLAQHVEAPGLDDRCPARTGHRDLGHAAIGHPEDGADGRGQLDLPDADRSAGVKDPMAVPGRRRGGFRADHPVRIDITPDSSAPGKAHLGRRDEIRQAGPGRTLPFVGAIRRRTGRRRRWPGSS